MTPVHHEVLIVGGGFGGYYAAHELIHHHVPVAIIDTLGHQTFQPLLYQAATGLIPPDDLDYSFSRMDRVTSIADTATAVDLDRRAVTLASGIEVTADHLVLATGSSVEFFGVTGAAEHALPLYTGTDARAIKHRLQQLALQSDGPIRVVVVGGGATGVEISGALLDVLMIVLPATFPEFTGREVTVQLVDRGDRLLASMSAESSSVAQRVLTAAGAHLHLGRGVTEVAPDSVTLDDGSTLAADLTIWAGGLTVTGPALTPEPDRGHGGRILIEPDLRLPGQSHVYCVGDASADRTRPLPQLGSVAKQQGRHVGESIRRQRTGKDPKPFGYRDMGDMAMIRHEEAVVEMGPRHHEVTGKPAYALWLGLHAYLLPGDRNRVEAMHDWMQELSSGTSRFLAD